MDDLRRTTTAMKMLDYNTVRSTIPDGAIMLSAGRGLAASIIRLWTRSAYSHCGILLWLGMNKEHLMLVEAVDQGVQMVRFSNYLDRAKSSRRMVAYGFHPQVSPTNIVPIKNHAIHLSGKPYDYAGLVGMGLDMLVDLPGESHDLPQKDKYVCSRVVLECLLAGGVRLEHRFGRITPDDISKQAMLVGRLV